MPPTLESQKWTRPSSFSTNPRGYVFFTRDCLLARNFLSLSNAAQGATAKNGRTRPDILQFMFNKKTNRSQTGDKGMKSKMLIATLLGCLVWQQGALSQTDTIATNPAATDEVAPANQPAIATDTNQSISTSTANLPTAPAVSAPESPSTTTSSITTSTVTTTNETADTSAANPPAAPAVSAPESPSTTTSSITTSTVTTTNETADTSAANPPGAPVISAPESPSTTTSSVTTSTVTTTNETAGASAANPPTAPVISAPESPSTTTSSVTTSTVTTSNATTGASAANSQPSAPPRIPWIQFQDVPITTAIENMARQAGINYLIDPKIGYGQPDQNGQIKAEPTLSIRWENVTAGQALMALLDNYGLQLSEDRKTQIARITAKDPMAPLPLSTRVVQLKYASTSNMVDSVQAALTDKRSRVIPDTRTSQTIVVATDKEQDAVDALINELDKPTRQVLIETKLVQISSNPQTAKGVDWSGTLQAQNVSFGNGKIIATPTFSRTVVDIPGTPTTTTSGGTPPIATTTPHESTAQTLLTVLQGGGGMNLNTLSGFTPAVGFLNADGANAVLVFLNSSYDAQIVSTPRIVTLDNQMATIEVTRGYPIIDMRSEEHTSEL